MNRRYQNNNFLKEPPSTFKHPSVKFDNVALVPASLLPLKSEWQAIANSLPQGEILVITPSNQSTKSDTMEKVIAGFESKGYKVTTLQVQQFS